MKHLILIQGLLMCKTRRITLVRALFESLEFLCIAAIDILPAAARVEQTGEQFLKVLLCF